MKIGPGAGVTPVTLVLGHRYYKGLRCALLKGTASIKMREIDPSQRSVNLKGIWPRRAPKARAVHAAGGLGSVLPWRAISPK